MPEQATCMIHRSKARTGRPSDIETFNQAEKQMTGIMVACGFAGGPFELTPTGQCASKKSSFEMVTFCDDFIRIKLKPGGSETSWKYDLRIPKGSTLTHKQVATALAEYDPKKGTRDAKRKESGPAADAKVIELHPEVQPSALGNTMALVAKGFSYAFTAGQQPSATDVKESLQTVFNWSEELAEQGFRLAVNRGYIRKLVGTDLYEVEHTELRRLLVEAGILAPEAPKPAPAPVGPVAKRDELAELAARALEKDPSLVTVIPSVPVTETKKPAAKKAALPKKAVAEKAASKPAPAAKPAAKKATPAISVTALSSGEHIRRLETYMQEFTDAQLQLAEGGERRSALEEAIAAAEQAATEAKALATKLRMELAALDGADDAALAIVSDPEHMEAQNKLELIQSILMR